MSQNPMKVSLSADKANECWGSDAILSCHNEQMLIHAGTIPSLSVIQNAARRLDAQGIHHVALQGEWSGEQCWAFWQGFRGAKGERTVLWPELPEAQSEQLQARMTCIDWVRHTINLPAEELGPEQLAQRAIDLLAAVAGESVSYRITKGDDLRQQGYLGLHTVGRGSSRTPALLALDYNPGGDETAPVFACLVGKGITFDTGGYSLKPSDFMESMKSDMGGAATLTGALALAIASGLKKRVRLYLCCADNMVSGNSFRLGDIIRYRNGKTVEVMNTDAEGRLVLADGLIDASEQQPELLIDAATLTGAAKIALGNDYHALFSFDDGLAQAMLKSAEEENEPFWRLPLAEFHRRQLPSGFADLNNVAAPAHTAGASTAAAFLSYFVKEYQKGWIHIDCSATYRKSAVEGWAVGATGIGVRTIANLLLHASEK
ncbi:MAG: Peptidase B [Candidatus Erwinia impunctatus]|nr:Peptidase B [Culicoides impunctatus]